MGPSSFSIWTGKRSLRWTNLHLSTWVLLGDGCNCATVVARLCRVTDVFQFVDDCLERSQL